MLARSLGRLAIPFSLFIILGTIVLLDRYLASIRCRAAVAAFVCALAAGVHVGEVRGYLVPPAKTFQGNQIASAIPNDVVDRVRVFTQGTSAILLVPDLRHKTEWGILGYSLGYHTGVPLTGPTVSFGESPDHLHTFDLDIRDARNGRISKLQKRYGSFAIAASKDLIAAIQERADVSLERFDLFQMDLALLKTETGIRPITDEESDWRTDH
jgi:hypothetical protein